MKLKTAKKDWTQTWPTTAVSIVSLVFVLLVSFGVITQEQSSQALPILNSTIGAIAAVITGVVSLVGILFKKTE